MMAVVARGGMTGVVPGLAGATKAMGERVWRRKLLGARNYHRLIRSGWRQH
jgi:hypothetical protein